MTLADGTTLAERLSAGLARPLLTDDILRGDHAGLMATDATALSAAAVLVAITDRGAPGVILTQRPNTMRRHAGQIAFPGGRIDPDDDGPVGAALREAEEEIALPRNQVIVLGTADRYRTGTGFEVTPVIGIVPPDLALLANVDEVADLFEVPLDFLLDAKNHRKVQAEWQGKMRHYYEIRWQERRIWGATAAMIINLSRRLR